MKAVHFGAGNIGRGFIGLLLHEAGFEVVFVDVDSALIAALNEAQAYTVREVGVGAREHTVTRFRALDSAAHPDRLVRELAEADIVTSAVGPTVLRFVAPAIATALAERDPSSAKLIVMACENAINATDILREAITEHLPDGDHDLLQRAVFANTAVDRIVPGPGDGLDVTVEAYFEWVIERPPFGDDTPQLPGAHFVDELEPFIERKLFTVNTGHATIAYHGFVEGVSAIVDALSVPSISSAVQRVLDETARLLVAKHGFEPREQSAYVQRILERFANPHLPDTVERVGRSPLRKLSRNERFISPAAQLAERGDEPRALVDAVGAALRFDVPSDDESVRLRAALAAEPPEAFAREVYGIGPEHPLFERLVEVTRHAR